MSNERRLLIPCDRDQRNVANSQTFSHARPQCRKSLQRNSKEITEVWIPSASLQVI